MRSVLNIKRHCTEGISLRVPLAALCTAILFGLLSGCQSGSNSIFPLRRNANPLASVPLPGSDGDNVWSPPGSARGPIDRSARQPMAQLSPYESNSGWDQSTAPTENPIGRLAELLRRQNEQSRLSVEQQQALKQLTAYQHQQANQLAQVAQQRKMREISKIQQQAELLQKQQMELQGLADLRRRAMELDANNRDLHTQLAQSQQQNRLHEDQLNLIKQQLNDTAQRLAESMRTQAELARQMQSIRQDADQQIEMAHQHARNKVAAVETTLRRRGGATIRANSSVHQKLATIQIAGVNVRQDGDVVRIELPSDQVFQPGTATLQPNGAQLIDRVASAIHQHYARQKIGIESHTDSRPPSGGGWRSNHQLSAAQAMAVFEQFTTRQQFTPQQLFVLGHGPNYPIASNGTPGGQQRNRRVEIVIYPETAGAP